MMIDNVLHEIMASKSNKDYKAWLKDRKEGTSHFKSVESEHESLNKKNLRISKMIDRLNENIKGIK